MAYRFERHPRLGQIIVASHHACGSNIDIFRLLSTIATREDFKIVQGENRGQRARIEFTTDAEQETIVLEYSLGVLRPVIVVEDGLMRQVAEVLNRTEC